MEQARSFAQRFAFADPAVYCVTVDARHVLAYYNGEEEEEFIIMLPASVKPWRVE